MNDQTAELLTIDDVAKILKVHPETVRIKIRNKEIKALNIGTARRPAYRVYRSELNSFLEKKQGESQKQTRK